MKQPHFFFRHLKPVPFFPEFQTTKTPEEPPPPHSSYQPPQVGHQGTRRTAQEKSLECLDTFR